MDLDVGDIEPTFRDRVREVLASRPFQQILQARGARDRARVGAQADRNDPAVEARAASPGAPAPLPTKVESRAGGSTRESLRERRPHLIRAYRLPPLMLSHYDAAAAFRQKVGALAGRAETQARDVFDLHHLLGIGALAARPAGTERCGERAPTRCPSTSATFKSQVLGLPCARRPGPVRLPLGLGLDRSGGRRGARAEAFMRSSTR